MPLPTLIDEIDRLFDELVHRPWGTGLTVKPVEIRRIDDGWVVEMQVEGMRAEDLSVDVHGRQLTVRGKRHDQALGRSSTGALTNSTRAASFLRTIVLPVEARREDIDVRLENSTLTIRVRRRSL